MGEIIDISSVKENIEKGIVPNDPNQLLKIVASSAKKSRGMKKDDFVNNPESFIRAKISSFLLEKEMINPDLFQCTLYVARIVSNKFNKTPESYYAIDYLLKAKAGDSTAFLRGGDCCFLLCTFFPERGRRRMIDSKYYLAMGKQMYLNFYYETQKTIGVNMHNNFCSMIKLVREVFN